MRTWRTGGDGEGPADPDVVGDGVLVGGVVVTALAVPEGDAAGGLDCGAAPGAASGAGREGESERRQAGRGRSGRAHTPIIGDPVCVEPASRLTAG